MPAQCWGPLIGAKVVTYRTAVVVGIVFQAVGMLAFGPETYTAFSGMLDDWTVLQRYPARLTLYVLMWIQVTPIIWHGLSIWRRMLLPSYLATSMRPRNAYHLPCTPNARHSEHVCIPVHTQRPSCSC